MKKVTKISEINHLKSTENKLKVAAYCRVSTTSDSQLESLEAQKAHYKKYIKAHKDWDFAGIYYDEGITGTKADKRPKLMQLIEDCKLKKIDFIITKSISRFSRNTTDCLKIVRTLLELNIPIYFEKENINTSLMESELFLSILSSMAESESTSISENSKWSIKKRFQNGTYKLSYAPYGYRWDGRTLRIIPEQAEVVKRIFTDVLSGKGTDAIAKALCDEGIPSKRGGKWTSTSVRGILANEKYTGDVIFQKTYTDDSFNRHTNKGELDMYYVVDHHEAIINKEDFEAAGIVIAQRAAEKGIQRESNKYQQRYAFSGKIICNECGDTFRRRMHSNTYGKYVAWCCNTHLADKTKCSMLFLRDEDLKVAFVTVLNKLIYSHKLVLKPYVVALQSNSGDENLVRIQHLERLLEQNTEQRETLTRLMAQGYIDQVLYNSETNALLSQANTYREDIDVINATMSGDSSGFFEAERLLHFAERGAMLEEYSEDLFERFVDHIQVYSRQEVGFVMKCGLTFKEMI